MRIFRLHKGIKELSDEELLFRFRENEDIEISSELFLRYKGMIYGVCLKYLKNKEDARDASMEIFEELLRKLPGQEIRNFRSWLYVLVRNFCLMTLRSNQRHIETELNETNQENFVENNDDLHPVEEREIRFLKLESAIEDLDSKQAECLKLFYLQEKSYQQIADKTGYELKKVKSYIQNGKRNLRKILDERSK